MKVLAFDIGIKNLAFCLMESKTVLALHNVNLLDDVEPIRCEQCKAKASFRVNDTTWCKRHIPKTHTVLEELSKKIPSNKVLKGLIAAHGCESWGATNEACIRSLSQKFAMPVTQPKAANASHVSLEIIHDALRNFVQSSWSSFSGCTHVLLENQPAFKNPHMKSVQVLLFAVLREAFLAHGETPSYHFVHAKKKVSGAPKGDAGYTERKNQSEARLVDAFESGQIQGTEWYVAWKAAKKKSDMADALCMAVDFV